MPRSWTCHFFTFSKSFWLEISVASRKIMVSPKGFARSLLLMKLPIVNQGCQIYLETLSDSPSKFKCKQTSESEWAFKKSWYLWHPWVKIELFVTNDVNWPRKTFWRNHNLSESKQKSSQKIFGIVKKWKDQLLAQN